MLQCAWNQSTMEQRTDKACSQQQLFYILPFGSITDILRSLAKFKRFGKH
jgi:hypothetical protein